jgi:hypothetical protein
MSPNIVKHYILTTLLLLSLIFNQGIGMLNSANAMSAMQSFSDEDTLVICTGTSVKWISASVFYDTGSIVEVDAPDDTPDNLHEVSCIFAQLNDSPKNSIFVSLQNLVIPLLNTAVETTKLLIVPTDYVNNFNARAPPTRL